MAFPGPTPPYSNPPIEPQYYIPSKFYITDVVLGENTEVAVSENCNFVIGQLVRLLFPITAGCSQLNQQEGYVIMLPSSTQIVIEINSSNSDAFVSNPSAKQQPQILAIGDINSGTINKYGNVNFNLTIPGSFTNIS